MRRPPLLFAIVSICVLPLFACAQEPLMVEIPSFEGLKAKATESVDITIGPGLLWLARGMMGNHGPDSAEVKKMLSGFRSVRIRSFEFASDFVYSKADVDRVRAQLTAPHWSQVVHTQDKDRNEDVDIYVALDNQVIKGLTIVASEPREFTVVNIVGTIDPKQIAKLQHHLGIPHSGPGRDLAYDM